MLLLGLTGAEWHCPRQHKQQSNLPLAAQRLGHRMNLSGASSHPKIVTGEKTGSIELQVASRTQQERSKDMYVSAYPRQLKAVDFMIPIIFIEAFTL